ncbi:protein PLANT CADMIUM RESISTANCE 10 isoform X2 [Brassica napus]|uniref:protein PLANT CADMIUM RESISTANCE 10 isoform X2 n=1 Tax=Brassica napus TaxID=3708 RepID=UPI002078E17E|nr:protein PLANT CADMIUM RESISTANCE 10 isoform X2 [Brassica napus]
MVVWHMRLLRRHTELYATILCPPYLDFTTGPKFGFIGLFCPCYIFGKNAELLGSGKFAGPCLTHCISWALVNTICCFATNGVLLGLPGCFVSCYACGYRRSLRTKYNLQEAPCGDFVTHFFCHLCAICQEYREIRERSSGSNPPDMKMAVTDAPIAQTMEPAN